MKTTKRSTAKTAPALDATGAALALLAAAPEHEQEIAPWEISRRLGTAKEAHLLLGQVEAAASLEAVSRRLWLLARVYVEIG